MLLNDDNNDEEETLGEYVQSTKQLKKIRRRVEIVFPLLDSARLRLEESRLRLDSDL